MPQAKTFNNLLRILGPGLLFASMAIGTSHLVLSTKGGAQYGWVMIIPIVLANILKYPFFEFGVRYTNVTQKSLIEGYRELGKKYLWFYAGVTLVSVLTLLAALYIVTTGLLMNLLKINEISIGLVSFLIFVFISVLLIIGRYHFLERSLKLVVGVLFAALIITTVLVVFRGQVTPTPNFEPPQIFDEIGILFLIALMGWMPTAVEASAWVSMWSVEKLKSTKNKISISESLAEFNVGYFLTALLAIFFLIIGTMTLYGTGTELSGNAVVFADQLVNLFTAHIGGWAYPIITIAAFATMFSTCMTAHDAIARVSLDIMTKLYPNTVVFTKRSTFGKTIVILALINYLVIILFSSNMGQLVLLATFVSFVMAPFIGWMNHKVVYSTKFPEAHRPNKAMKILSYLGMLFLVAFAVYYCWISFF